MGSLCSKSDSRDLEQLPASTVKQTTTKTTEASEGGETKVVTTQVESSKTVIIHPEKE